MKKFNLVDSCGWLEYISGSLRGKEYYDPVNDYENLIVPSICIFEVFKKILIHQDEEEALRVVANMQLGRVVDMDGRVAIDATQLSKEHKIPMADSIILATARIFLATIWTQDNHFKGMKSVKYFGK
ncbi:MAG: type II toxin-antitoxin system VapC family toxin [Candidatus Riflebacteria bacterium]|nr:type II toxin-antitoxin system VapC family toxin [Candidatus Riflebacteria bacterium]